MTLQNCEDLSRLVDYYFFLQRPQTMATNISLSLYAMKKKPSKETFYNNSSQSKLIFQARAGDLPVRWRSYHWDKLGNGKNCLVCEKGKVESLEHFMLECQSLPFDAKLSNALRQCAELPSLSEKCAAMLGLRKVKHPQTKQLNVIERACLIIKKTMERKETFHETSLRRTKRDS